MNEPASAAEKRPQSGPPYRRQLLILSVIVGAILLFIAVAILVYLGLRGRGQTGVPTPTPTRDLGPTATALMSPVPAPSCETIISSGNVEVSVALPVSLTVGGAASYPVEPIVPRVEAWTYPPAHSGKAVWVCGTVVNYVIGLEPDTQNEELLRGLAPGDEVELYLSNGTVLSFRLAERQETDPGAEAALAQRKPRLTLVLPRSDSWQIAVADYAAGAESVAPVPADVSAQPNQPVELNGVRMTMTRGYVERTDDAPPGTAYFLVEFSVENVGDVPLATDTFSTRLRDSLGNTYLLSPQAAAAGESGPLSGEIPPGGRAEGSAGYVVPEPLPTGELAWIFSPRPGSVEVSVGIPYEGTEETVSRQPGVTITEAFLSDDGGLLVIEGEIRNRGTQPLVVERSEVVLSSSAGAGELVTEAPPLPWEIQPGQQQVVELQFQRPEATTVVLEILGYSFEIGGLQ